MNTREIIQGKYSLSILKTIASIVMAILMVACGGGGTTGFDSDFHLIVPHTGVASGVGDIDGVNSDAKWGSAFDIQLIDGVPVADNHFWGVADNSYFYLYLTTAVDDFNEFDAVVIALSPTADPAQKHLLVIYPCQNTAQCAGTQSNINTDIDYYTDPDGDNTYTSAGATTAVAKAYVSESGGSGVWSVEVRIPRAAPFNLPANGFFGMFVGVLDYDPFASNVFQYTWPFNNSGGTTLLSGTLSPGSTDVIPLQAHWGNVSLDSNLPTGVGIASQDISTNHGTSVISINQSNVFTARAHNHGTSIAQSVQANFKLANFGLPSFGSWESIGNSTASNINPTASQDYTLNWTVPADRVDDYTAHPHQCIRVDLSSSILATSFINTSAQRNMDFVVTSSPFTSKPTIATKGYHLSKKMRQEDFIIKERFYNYRPELKWKSTIEGAKKLSKNMYQLSIPLKQSKSLDLSVLPPEQALTPFTKLVVPELSRTRESKVARLPVRSGKIITLIPNATAKMTTSLPRELSAVKKEVLDTKKLDGNLLDVKQGSANLVGSWDDFKKTRFTVQPGTSLVVPDGVKVLSVKQETKNGDIPLTNALQLNVYMTDRPDLPRHLRSSLDFARDKLGFLGFGANLPTAAYFGYRSSGKTLNVGKQQFNVYESAGSFGYVVKGRRKDQ